VKRTLKLCLLFFHIPLLRIFQKTTAKTMLAVIKMTAWH